MKAELAVGQKAVLCDRVNKNDNHRGHMVFACANVPNPCEAFTHICLISTSQHPRADLIITIIISILQMSKIRLLRYLFKVSQLVGGRARTQTQSDTAGRKHPTFKAK
jgi:hypothetical protein